MSSCLTMCTPFSAFPFNWGYSGLDITCWNSYSTPTEAWSTVTTDNLWDSRSLNDRFHMCYHTSSRCIGKYPSLDNLTDNLSQVDTSFHQGRSSQSRLSAMAHLVGQWLSLVPFAALHKTRITGWQPHVYVCIYSWPIDSYSSPSSAFFCS